jgi:hypothetical protein
MTTVAFFRDFRGFTGGHLKVWDYFNHVRSLPGYRATVLFSPSSTMSGENPWAREPLFPTARPDILFLAGLDWRAVPDDAVQDTPVVNLVQGLKHARSDNPRYLYLGRRAIRICVSTTVADAILATGRVRGPVITIPAGLDLDALPPALPDDQRDIDVVIVGVKQPRLARSIAKHLQRAGIVSTYLVEEQLERAALLALMRRAVVAVTLPHRSEGFYLPPLEAMALRTLVVCPDCGGNSGHCQPGENCLPVGWSAGDIVGAVSRALNASETDRVRLLANGVRTAVVHGLEGERRMFACVLNQLPELWAGA